MKKVIFFLAFTVLSSTSYACLNYYYSLDNTGHFHDAEGLRRAFNTNFNTKLIEAKLKKMEAKLKAENDYKLLSDYAVLLLKAGKTETALDILEQLSIKHPNDYQIAANLGTAYELSGNVEKALEYIQRGLELNPDSHGGSEWVHVKLLETKLKLAEDESYLDGRSVLELTAEQKKDTRVRDQLMIQIRERFPFCKGPDPIMASLLIDLGDCYANTSSIEFARAAYKIAKHYYGALEEIVDPKIAQIKSVQRQFVNLRPDRNTLRREDDHGEHVRMSGINYKQMLDDNNPDNYTIDWKFIQTNPDSLLSYAQIERFVPPTEEADTIRVQAKETSKPTEKESSDSNWIYFILGGVGLGIVVVFFALRRR